MNDKPDLIVASVVFFFLLIAIACGFTDPRSDRRSNIAGLREAGTLTYYAFFVSCCVGAAAHGVFAIARILGA
jgi:hypothetical protein